MGGLVSWRASFSESEWERRYSEQALSVRCGSLSSWTPVSLLAALISWAVLLHSVGNASVSEVGTCQG